MSTPNTTDPPSLKFAQWHHLTLTQAFALEDYFATLPLGSISYSFLKVKDSPDGKGIFVFLETHLDLDFPITPTFTSFHS